MFLDFVNNFGKWINSGAPVSSNSLWEERIAICENCEFYKNERCQKCGCFMKIKAKMLTSSCPAEKWKR